MVEFVWQDQYLLDNHVVDLQHKELFTLANQLVSSQDHEALKENAMHLYRHVREHFQAEEAFMKQIAYPNLAKHAETHDKMLDELVALSDKIHKNEWQQQDVLAFIRWWVAHILDEDAEIRDFLNPVA